MNHFEEKVWKLFASKAWEAQESSEAHCSRLAPTDGVAITIAESYGFDSKSTFKSFPQVCWINDANLLWEKLSKIKTDGQWLDEWSS